ncbi:NAD-binding protein [Mycena belliarum]|uniref:NAD-binding protein n=1 Tax=Mycena belliarum TaxID=1033014 RepID=A0AAD6UGZ4_9AGAR|nr:NAD-binding protein [Mycena belliae]
MRVLIFGSTGPTGILLVREVLSALQGCLAVLYVRAPDKLPDDLRTSPSCIVVDGQLDDIDSLSKAMEGVDLVLSALGPSQFSQPPETMHQHKVTRLIALGTASVEAKEDKFNLAYSLMVKSVMISMRNAYKDIRALAAVIQESGLESWTIVRVPILSNDTSREVIAGYIGDGKTQNHVLLTRIGFAAFVVGEIAKREWSQKVPLLVSP